MHVSGSPLFAPQTLSKTLRYNQRAFSLICNATLIISFLFFKNNRRICRCDVIIDNILVILCKSIHRKKAAVFFAISHVRAAIAAISHGVLKSEKKVCSAFRPAKNDANSAQQKEKGYAVFGKFPVCTANTFRTTQLESKSTTRTIAASAGAASL